MGLLDVLHPSTPHSRHPQLLTAKPQPIIPSQPNLHRLPPNPNRHTTTPISQQCNPTRTHSNNPALLQYQWPLLAAYDGAGRYSDYLVLCAD